MKLIDLKCKNCGGIVKLEPGKDFTICDFCGSTLLIHKNDQCTDEQQKKANNTDDTSHSEVSTNINNNNIKKERIFSEKLVPFFKFLPIIFISVFIIYNISTITRTRSAKISQSTFFDSTIQSTDSTELPQSTLNNSESVGYRAMPKTKPVISFVESVFGKNISKITPEDFSKIEYISIVSQGGLSWDFSYSFEDYHKTDSFESTLRNIEVSSSGSIDAADFQCFTGLRYLNFNHSSGIIDEGYNGTDFNNLVNLTAYGGSSLQNMFELTEYVPAHQLDYLEIEMANGEMEKVQYFTSLKHLHIDMEYFDFPQKTDDSFQFAKLSKLEELSIRNPNNDLSFVTYLPNLKTLKIENGAELFDYSDLYRLPKIESLYLNELMWLENINFVGSMPRLKSLTVSRGSLIDIKPLKNKTSLLQLTITENKSEINNFDELATLTSLQELHFSPYESFSGKLVDLSHFENLHTVSASKNALPYLPKSIENMIINNSYELFDCNMLLDFSNLKKLTVENTIMQNSQALIKLDNLEVLLLNSVDVQSQTIGNSSESPILGFLNHPKLKDLQLSAVYLDKIFIDYAIENNLSNPVLKTLSVDPNCNFKINNDNESTNLPFGNIPQFFEIFIGLTELSIYSSSLSTVSFVEKMPNLEKLAIKDNYVTDVSAISKLKKLKYFDCSFNPITNLGLVPKEVFVVTEFYE